MKSFAVMPSNIALIKYMGKSEQNLPLNASLSYTTPKFESYVEVQESKESSKENQDTWEELSAENIAQLYQSKILKYEFLEKTSLKLDTQESEKFLRFFRALKALNRVEKNYIIRSYNAFPSSCGMASSASSFAALTVAAYKSFLEKDELSPAELSKLSSISQKGSGSSCRSFFKPWAIWDKLGARQAALMLSLDHYVVAVDTEKKKVSSSEAHMRVLTSENFTGRAERAQKRLDELLFTLEKNWARAVELCWNEFWDMHSLFETARPPFGYLKPASLSALEIVKKFWTEEDVGPLVTMDAGANLHLLFREEDEGAQEEVLKRLAHFRVF